MQGVFALAFLLARAVADIRPIMVRKLVAEKASWQVFLEEEPGISDLFENASSELSRDRS